MVFHPRVIRRPILHRADDCPGGYLISRLYQYTPFRIVRCHIKMTNFFTVILPYPDYFVFAGAVWVSNIQHNTTYSTSNC